MHVQTNLNRAVALKRVLVAMMVAGIAPTVAAGPKFEYDETKWLSIGGGLRTSFTNLEDAADNGDNSNDFDLESIRLYVNAQIHQNILFEFNTEKDSDDDIRVLDGIAKFQFNDYFNVWAGRLLPPSDRSNLSGPYYLNALDFPFVQNYPAIFAGRDDGAAVWGQTGGGVFKYQFGAFEGREGGSNDSDNLLYAGRLTYNFWDPEPGYYNSSTYYGSQDVLALGLVGMFQEDGAGNVLAQGDFNGWNVDALMEKKLGGGGVVTLEGAYYDYDQDDLDVVDPAAIQGDGYFVLASYLFPQVIGIGKLQPQLRYQSFDRDIAGERERTDIGLTYVINGHNARISAVYSNEEPGPGLEDFDQFKVGLQLQF